MPQHEMPGQKRTPAAQDQGEGKTAVHFSRRVALHANSPSMHGARFRGLLSSERLFSPAMSEVTRILSAIEQGDPSAADQLLPLVYDELRKLAAQKMALEKPGQTLQPTALVHEAYLRLIGN